MKTEDNSDYPTYQTHDPKGWCGDPKRGAALGRHSYLGSPLFDGKFLLRGIRLDRGGYDCNGTYFGVGQPLFWFASPHEDGIDDVLRATNREDARQQILKRYPKAKFFR